jgi:hypothetical protein
VVIGEGERDEAPMLYIGEEVGSGHGPAVDIALDPLEGTTLTAKDMPNALTVIAMGPRGSMLYAPDVYMDKLAIGPGYPEGIVTLAMSPTERILALAKAKRGKPSDVMVCVLERPRHAELVREIRETGARIRLITDGDVAGVIHCAETHLTGIDMYMGAGGAPEGVLAAAAMKCMNGQMQGRLLFRNDDERGRARKPRHRGPRPDLHPRRDGQRPRHLRRDRRHRRLDRARGAARRRVHGDRDDPDALEDRLGAPAVLSPEEPVAPMAARRRSWVKVGFLVVWLVFWIAGMVLAVRAFGAEALEGAILSGLVLLVWLAPRASAVRHVLVTLFEELSGERLRPERERPGRDPRVERRHAGRGRAVSGLPAVAGPAHGRRLPRGRALGLRAALGRAGRGRGPAGAGDRAGAGLPDLVVARAGAARRRARRGGGLSRAGPARPDARPLFLARHGPGGGAAPRGGGAGRADRGLRRLRRRRRRGGGAADGWLRALGRPATLYVPDRIDEGYGPNEAAMAALGAAHDLIVCVDCGTLSHGPIAAAGCDVLVVDHHLGAETLPPAVAVVNPNRQDEDGALGYLCAAGVVFLLLVAVNRVMRAEGAAGPDLLGLLDLVALATVADVAPLVGLNRALVRQGLRVMRGRGRPGLAALAEVGRLHGPPGVHALGFVFGPRVNAGGRIGAADLGARLLATDDPHEAAALAARLDALNAERRAIEAAVRAEAEGTARGLDGPLVWAAGEGWHPGVVGIVAARLKEAHGRPAVVIGLDGGTGKGSGRSVTGVDLGAAVVRLMRRGADREGRRASDGRGADRGGGRGRGGDGPARRAAGGPGRGRPGRGRCGSTG